MKKKLLAGYVVALHVALAVIAVHDEVPARVAVKLGLAQAPDWPGVAQMQAVHLVTDANVPPGAVIFLGDSITEALPTAAVAPLSVNFGISGQRSDQLLRGMDAYASMQRAGAVVLTIGTNDVRSGRVDGLAERHRAIVAKVPAAVPLVVSSVPPSRIMDVAPAVEAARSACAARPGCVFVDASALSASALQDDGVHLSAAGYAAWIQMLRQALVTPRAPAASRQGPSARMHPPGSAP